MNNKLLERIREEKINKISGGIYHELQILLTYNSNHIEGSKLTEEETRYIFETRTINKNEPINIDDILETVNHFNAINYTIDNVEKELDEKFIKQLHKILKTNTYIKNEELYIPGEYKKINNTVGGIDTTDVLNVEKEIQKLLKNYNSIKVKKIENIIEFHYIFECIHPFYDGNGRVGRLIILKECLKNNIVPPIIEDEKKYFYYRGLKEYKNDKAYLIDTFLDGQDKIKKLLHKFNIN